MQNRFSFLALLAIAGMSIWLGIVPQDGLDHRWLNLALFALFAASEARYWGPTKPTP